MNTDRRDNAVVFIDPQNYHGCPTGTDHDRDVPEIDLLSPLTIRGVTLRNRIVSGLSRSISGTSRSWSDPAGQPW